jgi:hypothetical protein
VMEIARDRDSRNASTRSARSQATQSRTSASDRNRAGAVLSLQRSIGNRSVMLLLESGQRSTARGVAPRSIPSTPVQRCGDISPDNCPCHDDGSPESPVQRQSVVQRDGGKDPADLSGTVYDRFHPDLKKLLADKNRFDWSEPTLAATLDKMDQGKIAILSRIGTMITASGVDFLWPFIKKIRGEAWITDNFGIRVEWTDTALLNKELAAHKNFCKDNPRTAMKYHETTSAYRQWDKSGEPSLHIITEGKTELHIDVHQPVEGKEENGQCNYHALDWLSHAADVAAGGGARKTAVGRYAVAKVAIYKAREHAKYDKAVDEPKLSEAAQQLESIAEPVRKYATAGELDQGGWKGDKEMLRDVDTMSVLERAEENIRRVQLLCGARQAATTPVRYRR